MSQHEQRAVHLVGSVPAPTNEQAMRDAIRRLGTRLHTLPDGETGPRRHWLIGLIESLRAHPDLELSREGDWSAYDRLPTFRIRPGRKLSGRSLDLGILTAYERSFPVFQRTKQEAGLYGLTFQIGVPGDFDMAWLVLGRGGALRHRRPFTEATVREVTEVHRRAGPSVLFQLEVPVEFVLATRTPAVVRRAVAGYLAAAVTRIPELVPEGARFGVHFCVGDLGNQAVTTARDAAPLVALANAVLERWPRGRSLEYVHAPFAGGRDPAPLDETFYRPLSRLRLPAEVRLIAGFVHEVRDLDANRHVLSLIEHAAGRRVDVATACGLGRRTPEAASRTMELAAQLAAVP